MTRAVVCSLIGLLALSAGGFALTRGGGRGAAPPSDASRADRAVQSRAATRPAADAPQARPARPRSMPSDYQVLLDRSMFARKAPQRPDERRARAAPPEASFVLRGVTVHPDDVTALIEDVEARRVYRVHAGDPLGRGRVRRVGLDGVEYEADGRATRVAVGHDLRGAAAAPVAAPATAVAARAAPEPRPDDADKAGRRKRRGEAEGDATAASPVGP